MGATVRWNADARIRICKSELARGGFENSSEPAQGRIGIDNLQTAFAERVREKMLPENRRITRAVSINNQEMR
jgi:hypothetical protein